MSAKGAIDRWSYLAGVYAASFDGDYNESFESDGSNYGLASIACDFGNESQIWGKAMVTAQYAYLNDPTRVGPRFDHTTSLSFEGTSRKFGLAMDFMYGWGDNEVGGFHIIPSYFVTDKIELVARYSWASGDDDTLALRRRYETLTTRGSGDEYHSIYAGANYYLYGHKLKLLLGAEYLNMSDSAKNGGDFDGVTAMAGLAFWF